MRYLIILSLVFLVQLVLPAPAKADCKVGQAVCINVLIEVMEVDLSGVSILTSGNESRLDGCILRADKYLRLDITQSGYDALFARLLSAHLQKVSVDIRLTMDSSPCQIFQVT